MSDSRGRSFLDTNIFVYAIDSAAPVAKQQIARELVRESLRTHSGAVSYQVVQEFVNVALKKVATPLSIPDLRQYISVVFAPMLLDPPSAELFEQALHIRDKHKLAWYDSLIVTSAARGGCSVLWSEDLQDGARIDGVLIKNPFRPSAQ